MRDGHGDIGRGRVVVGRYTRRTQEVSTISTLRNRDAVRRRLYEVVLRAGGRVRDPVMAASPLWRAFPLLQASSAGWTSPP